MTQYRKKPVIIEAFRWMPEQVRMDGEYPLPDWIKEGNTIVNGDCLEIFTLEGVMRANPGDWIIKGVKGELYPCKPDIFEATYEVVKG